MNGVEATRGVRGGQAPRPDPPCRHGLRPVIAAIALLVLPFAPNLIWLASSTVRIHNASGRPIADVAYLACERPHAIGELDPDESVFRLLPGCGDDTLEILIGQARFCQTYVEGEMYHVDADIRAAGEVHCAYDEPFSSLFIGKLLR